MTHKKNKYRVVGVTPPLMDVMLPAELEGTEVDRESWYTGVGGGVSPEFDVYIGVGSGVSPNYANYNGKDYIGGDQYIGVGGDVSKDFDAYDKYIGAGGGISPEFEKYVGVGGDVSKDFSAYSGEGEGGMQTGNLLSKQTLLDVYAAKWGRANLEEIDAEIGRLEAKKPSLIRQAASKFIPSPDDYLVALKGIRKKKAFGKYTGGFLEGKKEMLIVILLVLLVLCFFFK